MKAAITVEEWNSLRRCFLFREADEEVLRKAVDLAQVRDYPKGAVVYDMDDCARELGLILSGRVEVTKGAGFVMNTLSPGSVFGSTALFHEGEKFVTRVTASVQSRIVFFSQEQILNLMRENFSIAESYMAFLTHRIRFLNGKIGGLLLSGSETAVRHWLQQNLQRNGSACYVQAPSYTKLANMLNMSRSSLYRAFDELENAGVIRKNGKRIDIPHPENLVLDEN